VVILLKCSGLGKILSNFRPQPPYRPPIYFQGSFAGCFSLYIKGSNWPGLNRCQSCNLFACQLNYFNRSGSVSVLYSGSGLTYRSLTGCYSLPLFGPFLVSFPLILHHPFIRPFSNPVGVSVQKVWAVSGQFPAGKWLNLGLFPWERFDKAFSKMIIRCGCEITQ